MLKSFAKKNKKQTELCVTSELKGHVFLFLRTVFGFKVMEVLTLSPPLTLSPSLSLSYFMPREKEKKILARARLNCDSPAHY